MRHQKQKNSSFGRHRGPRKALIRGLITSLVERERIKTTVPKAKCIRPLIEKAITMGKKGSVHSTRILLARYPNKKTVDKIMNNLSPRFKDRLGGYTRIIKLGFRSGDQAPLAYLEFVDYNENLKSTKSTKKESEVITKKEVATVKNKDTKKEATTTKTKETKKTKRQTVDPKKLDKKRKTLRSIQKKSRRINR